MTNSKGINGKIIFLNTVFPMETRHAADGQLANLVYNLNKNGIDSSVALLIRNPLFERGTYHTLRSRLAKTIVSIDRRIPDLYRRVILGYKKSDLIQVKSFPIWDVCDLSHSHPHFVVTWDWVSAYYLNKCNAPSFRKIQVLHYGPLEEYLKDYMPADLTPKVVEAYYSGMTKVAISKKQIGDFNGRKVYHWLQGINVDIFFRQKTSIGDPPRILIPLRNPKEKGAIYALQAAEIIFRHNRDVAINSFGDYKGNIPGFINHHGRVNFSTLLELYRGSDIFVIPSIEEGFSLPGLEAMASGCALVSTRNGGSEQYITDRHDGILVEPGDSLALANAVIELIENRRLLKKIIVNARETVREYSYEKATERFIEILRNIEENPSET